MSYQVLARKWRPRRFSEMVGQEHVVRALANALDSGRTHHAYLFTGTRGVGKTTIARIFAKSLNCERGQSAEPCGECAVCQAVDAGRFVDLLEIDAASNTSVDDVREMIENAQYAPARGRYKVYLVDEVHMLSRSAFNALLKTLEEPPPHVKFLLATTDPQKLPATVLSRCLRFNLKRLLPEQIRGQIRHILDAEGIEHEEDAVDELARAADGSLRDGLSLLDQAIAYGNGALRTDEVRAMLGTVERNQLFDVLDAIAAGDGKALVAACDHMASFSPDFSGVLDALATLLHRIQLHQLIPGYEADRGDEATVARLATSMDAQDVQLYYQLALSGQRELGLAPDMRTGFEMTLLRMLAFRPEPDDTGSRDMRRRAVADRDGATSTRHSHPRTVTAASASSPSTTSVPKATVEAVRTNPLAAPSEPPAAPASHEVPAAPAAKIPAGGSPAAAGDLPDWEALIGKAGLHGLMRELAVNASLQSIEGGKMTLALPADKAGLVVEPMAGQMQEKLGAALGYPVKLKFVHAPDVGVTPAAKAQATRDRQQQAAEQSIETDPFVQAMKRDFDATVVARSVRPNKPTSPESHS